MEEVAKELVNVARQYALAKYWDKAFEAYIRTFETCPTTKNRYELEFRQVYMKLNQVLAEEDKIAEIFQNFGRSMKIFPTNIHLLNDIGVYLYRFGFYSEAWDHFQNALFIEGEEINAEKNFNSVKSNLIDRWHYRMLNDKIRNVTYRKAIRQILKPTKDSVLDLGAGPGLLSMFAHEFIPVAVTAVDTSEAMTQLAECVTQGCGIMDIIIVSNVPTRMNFLDIGGKRSLLITEMFDSGLFGEQILRTLKHAWVHFLSNVGRILPGKAEVFVAGIQSNDLIRKYQLQPLVKALLNVPDMNVHVLTHDETYDSEDIHLYKDVVYMTEAESLVKVNFNDPKDLEEQLNRKAPYNVKFRTKEQGEINAVIAWFNLYLTDKVTLTTDPRSARRCNAWQQAVFFDITSLHVKENQTIDMQFFMRNEKLALGNGSDSHITRISPETLRFLNDTELVNAIMGYIGVATIHLGQLTDMSQITVVDLCSYPLFGLQMLKRGARSLICTAKTLSDKNFIKKTIRAHDISLNKVKILTGDEWDVDVFRFEKYHAIMTNFLDLCGDIDIRMHLISQHLRRVHLVPGGLFLPHQVKMVAQAIQSHWVDITNKVNDENVCNFDVARHLNRFSVSQNYSIDFGLLEYEALTDPVEVGTCHSTLTTDFGLVKAKKAGEANAVLCWYKIEFVHDLSEVSTGRSDAFVYGTLFIPPKNVPLKVGQEIKLLRSVDACEAFRVSIEPPTPPPKAAVEGAEKDDDEGEAAAV